MRRLSGLCWEAVHRVSAGTLDGVGRMFGECVEMVGSVQGGCL